MISQTDIEWEKQIAILWFRKNAKPCHTCGKPPDHDYQAGARLIWCGGEKCQRSVTDSNLTDGFKHWNSLQNSLAMRVKK